MDFRHTRVALGRSPLDYGKVRAAAAPFARAWPFRKTPAPGAYLNVGCGPFAKPDFFNIDYDLRPGVDLLWDLAKPLPIASGSIGGVFTEHCLEHLPLEMTRKVLREFNRVLKPGGVVRISLPDAGIYIRHYVDRTLMPYQTSIENPMNVLNFLFYASGHKHIFDHEDILQELTAAGLKAEASSFGVGRDPKLLIEQEGRRCESLYVEGVNAV